MVALFGRVCQEPGLAATGSQPVARLAGERHPLLDPVAVESEETHLDHTGSRVLDLAETEVEVEVEGRVRGEDLGRQQSGKVSGHRKRQQSGEGSDHTGIEFLCIHEAPAATVVLGWQCGGSTAR